MILPCPAFAIESVINEAFALRTRKEIPSFPELGVGKMDLGAAGNEGFDTEG